MARKSSKRKALDKKKSSRRAAAVDSGRSGKASTRRTKSVGSTRRSKAVRRGGSAPTGNVWLTCRDCSCDFAMDPAQGKQQETLTCPVCEHRAQAPSEDILHQIGLYKGIEHKNLGFALGALGLGVFSMVFWAFITSNQETAADPLVFYGPIGLAAVALIVMLVFGTKYERSRWITFF